MEPAVANLYKIFLEDTYKFSFPVVTPLILQKDSNPHEKRIQRYKELSQVLQKLSFWRNAPSSKSWALEKLSDVLCSDIASDSDSLTEEDLAHFVNGFFDENRKLIQYPDFVMNEVTKILTAILLSGKVLSEGVKKSAYSVFRSVFDYGLINKGHRIQTIFKSLQQFLKNPVSLDLMYLDGFDVSFALTVCLISNHNYTRKSAQDYIVKLIQFAFEETTVSKNIESSPVELKKMKMKAEIKGIIVRNIFAFNEKLVNCYNKVGTESAFVPYDCSIYANYCEVLCSCADASDAWCTFFDSEVKPDGCCLFDFIFSLLKDVNLRGHSDDSQLTITSIRKLVHMSNLQQDIQIRKETIEKLSHFIIDDLCQQSMKINLIELMQISHAVLFQYDCPTNISMALSELSLLPLLIILGVPLTCSQHLKPEIVEKFTQNLKTEYSGKFPVLIDYAVKIAFEMESQKVESDLLPVISYVTMKSQDHPSIVTQPFLRHGEVRNTENFACILSSFRYLIPALYKNSTQVDSERVQCIGQYVETIMNSTLTLHEHLTTVFNCFLAILHVKQSKPDKHSYPDKRLVSSTIASLQLHMVSMNLSIREVAVKCLQDLYLLDYSFVTQELTEAKAFVSLWQCVRDKAEGVVLQVLDFILCVAMKGSLVSLLSCINITWEELNAELKRILLRNPLDTIKATAFQILSEICQTSEIVRYAEVSLSLESPRLAVVVLKFVEKLFKMLTENEEKNLETLCDKLVEGWGDLLLSKLNAQDVCAFRIASDVLGNLHEYFSKSKVNDTFRKMLVSVTDNSALSPKDLEKQQALKEKLLHYWEDLSQSFQKLRHMEKAKQESSALSKECDFDTPPCKMPKLDENIENSSSNNLNELESFLCTVAKYNRKRLLKDYMDRLLDRNKNMYTDDKIIDSTKELPSLNLETKPFPSQELVYTLLDSQQLDLNTAVPRCLTFITFREILSKLNVHALHEEAYQSTDQYARNEVVILEDLNNQLEISFLHYSHHLERVIVGLLINELSELVENLLIISKDEQFETPHLPLETFIAKLSHLTLFRRNLFEYIISKKKTIFLDKWNLEDSSFILDASLERHRHLQKHGDHGVGLKDCYSSPEDLMNLLNMFMKNRSEFQSESKCQKETPVKELSASSHTTAASATVLCVHSNEQVISAKETNFKLGDIDFLQKRLDEIMQLNQKKTSSVLDWLEKVCEILSCNLKESDNFEVIEKSLILVSKINHWYNAEQEDEFDNDGDNDPTLIDCF